eukprot:CAMPEP_0196743590 /NCGR_PEP_ID=MMETSP1091-20130531/53485_1 /TAXON_ID=302021 /ORGANISM="Rhodomonas sp., Strain CCMP768" /LENGTH=46 /DNA_ID= /DNA_START= /DNA_END= /DNA_ORIENTATION=
MTPLLPQSPPHISVSSEERALLAVNPKQRPMPSPAAPRNEETSHGV